MKDNQCGFSLWGLSAVLAAIVIFAALLIPACQRSMIQAGMKSTVANGANIYQSFFANQMDARVENETNPIWPQTGQYQTSTEFFIDLVTNGVMTVSYAFFSAPGIPPARSRDAADFTADNNAWRLVLDLDQASEGTPFLFTKNCDPDNLITSGGKLQLRGEPFGGRGLVVVLKGGAAFALKGPQVDPELFNPPESALKVVGP